MAKLVKKYDFHKDGSKNIKGYSIALSKSGIAETGLDAEKDLKITYSKNKIIIEKE